ncbi:MAG: hypothetical protein HFE62_00120 [Firmicutes bacterium]|nr:hypothetical protein [Bacillota bacterium]
MKMFAGAAEDVPNSFDTVVEPSLSVSNACDLVKCNIVPKQIFYSQEQFGRRDNRI